MKTWLTLITMTVALIGNVLFFGSLWFQMCFGDVEVSRAFAAVITIMFLANVGVAFFVLCD